MRGRALTRAEWATVRTRVQAAGARSLERGLAERPARTRRSRRTAAADGARRSPRSGARRYRTARRRACGRCSTGCASSTRCSTPDPRGPRWAGRRPAIATARGLTRRARAVGARAGLRRCMRHGEHRCAGRQPRRARPPTSWRGPSSFRRTCTARPRRRRRPATAARWPAQLAILDPPRCGPLTTIAWPAAVDVNAGLRVRGCGRRAPARSGRRPGSPRRAPHVGRTARPPDAGATARRRSRVSEARHPTASA